MHSTDDTLGAAGPPKIIVPASSSRGPSSASPACDLSSVPPTEVNTISKPPCPTGRPSRHGADWGSAVEDPDEKKNPQRGTYPLVPSSLPYCWRHCIHHIPKPNWIWMKIWRRNLPPPSIPLCHTPPPQILIILFLCGLTPHPPQLSLPSPPTYVTRKYFATPRAAMSLSIMSPVDEDKEEEPRRTSR